MRNYLLYLLSSCTLALAVQAQAQSTDKVRLKANLERAFAGQPPAPPAVQATDASDGILYYVQVLSSVRPLEGTGDKSLRTFPDLRYYRESRYLKYYTGAGTNDYSQAQTLLREVQAKGYPDAFIIALKYGVKLPLKDALAEQGIKQ